MPQLRENKKSAPFKYNNLAIVLHWVMAACFFVMLGSGFIMANFEINQLLKFQIYQWHKAGGVILLLAVILRLSWRLISGFRGQIPALPSNLTTFEQWAAKLGHWGLYALMFAIPVSGWAMVSSSVYGLPTIVFGLFEWPHIPGIAENERLEKIAKFAHLCLAILFALMILIHVAAVIKHALKDKINLIPRMWWGGFVFIFACLFFISTEVYAENYTVDPPPKVGLAFQETMQVKPLKAGLSVGTLQYSLILKIYKQASLLQHFIQNQPKQEMRSMTELCHKLIGLM